MPAAAVIPAPIAYIKVVAVEKLVVELVRFNSAGGLAGVGEQGEGFRLLVSALPVPTPLRRILLGWKRGGSLSGDSLSLAPDQSL